LDETSSKIGERKMFFGQDNKGRSAYFGFILMYRFDLLSRRKLGVLPFVLSGEGLKKRAINYRKSFHRLSGVTALATRWVYAMPVPKFQRACNFQLQGCVIKTLNHKYHAKMEDV
jgi:hypothetical protein